MGGREITYDEARRIVFGILHDAVRSSTAELSDWIEHKVPKRTGQLRASVYAELAKSNVDEEGAHLYIGVRNLGGTKNATTYAEYVNKMSDSQVQHHGTEREHSGKKAYAYYYDHHGAIRLDDPEAIGHFYDVYTEVAKEILLKNVSKLKNILDTKDEQSWKKTWEIIAEIFDEYEKASKKKKEES